MIERTYGDGLARVDASHPGHKNPTDHHDGLHYGIWYGKAKPHHAFSRRHQHLIVGAAGTEVWSLESLDVPEGTRVKYRFGFPDKLAIEALAIDVEPVEPVEPVAKVAKRK